MLVNNFEYLTMDIKAVDGVPAAEISFYASVLPQLPVAKEREDGQTMSFEIDSTVNLPEGPFHNQEPSNRRIVQLKKFYSLFLNSRVLTIYTKHWPA